MIPARVALALQADGWFLRSDIIWHKPNPMPESVTDRPTSAHEHVFLLTKRDRYFYDADAVREDATSDFGKGATGRGKNAYAIASGMGGNPHQDHSGWLGGDGISRNARNVWTIPTQPFSGAHFATMPPDLAERCILAGSRPGDTVLDPFGGAGTTGLVADRLNRNAILTELNPEYIAIARERIRDDAGMFAEVMA
jgi:DNA modification methylase